MVNPGSPPPRPRRSRGTLRDAVLTACVVCGAAALVAWGHAALSSRRSEAPEAASVPPATVRTTPLTLVGTYAVDRRFAGQFEAPQRVAQGFEEGGTIAAVLVAEGDRVAKGDVLARLDTALLDAERARLVAARDSMRAQVELASVTNARQSELRARGFASDQRADETSLNLLQLEAALSELEATVRVLDVRRAKAVLRAPWNGVVATRHLDVGAVAGSGAAVLTLLEAGLRFRAGLAPDVAEGLSPGDEVVVESGAGRFPARVLRLAPELDPATRARVLHFEVDAPVSPPVSPPERAPGAVILSSRVAADPPGAWAPLAALRPGSAGAWEILVVDGENRVGVEAVEILHAETDRAFVRGTFAPDARLVPEGVHRVVPGERVRVVEGAV
jgi:RND family efflux transporter MFP subunit